MKRRSHVPAALARRIDRLSRRAHRFHRYAHHPLCAAYAGELVQLGGRARVCRGCALTLAGAASGLVLAFALPSAALERAATSSASLAIAAVVVLAGVLSSSNHVRARLAGLATSHAKAITRLLPATSLALAFGLGLRLQTPFGALLAAGSLTAVVITFLRYRQRGPHRGPCASCPERSREVCSGYAPIVRAERAFARLSERWLSRGLSRAS